MVSDDDRCKSALVYELNLDRYIITGFVLRFAGVLQEIYEALYKCGSRNLDLGLIALITQFHVHAVSVRPHTDRVIDKVHQRTAHQVTRRRVPSTDQQLLDDVIAPFELGPNRV
jgi:hypothetical protein